MASEAFKNNFTEFVCVPFFIVACQVCAKDKLTLKINAENINNFFIIIN